jgi:hypothetical protein
VRLRTQLNRPVDAATFAAAALLAALLVACKGEDADQMQETLASAAATARLTGAQLRAGGVTARYAERTLAVVREALDKETASIAKADLPSDDRARVTAAAVDARRVVDSVTTSLGMRPAS